MRAADTGKQFGNIGSSESLYLGGRYAEILEFLCSESAGAANVKVLVSEPGLGKTFLLYAALAQMQSAARTAFLFWTQLQPHEFVRSLLVSVGSAEVTAQVENAQRQFETVLENAARDGKRFVLAIDEAHNLGPPLLDILATLIDSALARTRQLQVILAAQPALRATLSTPGASRLRERVAGLMSIPPLTHQQTAEYIHHRFSRSIGAATLSQEVVAAIVARSNGIPRIINRFCILYEIDKNGGPKIDTLVLNRALGTESIGPPSTMNAICPEPPAKFGTKRAGRVEAARELTASEDQTSAHAPKSTAESDLSEPGFRIKRICNWFCSHSGEWSGTAAELAIASGTCEQGMTELLRAGADELRKFGIAAHVERRPGRPRIVRLCRLHPDVRITLR
jgi:type II secretory pathway predicted ATPase ExeA